MVTHPSISRGSRESNSRPLSLESDALTTRLPSRSAVMLCSWEVKVCITHSSCGNVGLCGRHLVAHPLVSNLQGVI